ncbi:hypothetical protein LY76DRAFT_653626 [Colletotrichum caudatum]|nr:hypothetical protein LY76DRAFT_653626 [Colletotrichum caudatum]
MATNSGPVSKGLAPHKEHQPTYGFKRHISLCQKTDAAYRDLPVDRLETIKAFPQAPWESRMHMVVEEDGDKVSHGRGGSTTAISNTIGSMEEYKAANTLTNEGNKDTLLWPLAGEFFKLKLEARAAAKESTQQGKTPGKKPTRAY